MQGHHHQYLGIPQEPNLLDAPVPGLVEDISQWSAVQKGINFVFLFSFKWLSDMYLKNINCILLNECMHLNLKETLNLWNKINYALSNKSCLVTESLIMFMICSNSFYFPYGTEKFNLDQQKHSWTSKIA